MAVLDGHLIALLLGHLEWNLNGNILAFFAWDRVALLEGHLKWDFLTRFLGDVLARFLGNLFGYLRKDINISWFADDVRWIDHCPKAVLFGVM